jgi:hypothetical protein
MPPGVSVFGIRGAGTWRQLLDYWSPRWPTHAAFLLVPDGDDAGRAWHGEFARALAQRAKKIVIFSYVLTRRIAKASSAATPAADMHSPASDETTKAEPSGQDTNAKKLVLETSWASKTSMSGGGGSDTMADLKKLLSS